MMTTKAYAPPGLRRKPGSSGAGSSGGRSGVKPAPRRPRQPKPLGPGSNDGRGGYPPGPRPRPAPVGPKPPVVVQPLGDFRANFDQALSGLDRK